VISPTSSRLASTRRAFVQRTGRVAPLNSCYVRRHSGRGDPATCFGHRNEARSAAKRSESLFQTGKSVRSPTPYRPPATFGPLAHARSLPVVPQNRPTSDCGRSSSASNVAACSGATFFALSPCVRRSAPTHRPSAVTGCGQRNLRPTTSGRRSPAVGSAVAPRHPFAGRPCSLGVTASTILPPRPGQLRPPSLVDCNRIAR
jgi:hypothetical protein